MDILVGQIATIDFTVTNPLTGMVSDADFLPTCEIFEDTTDVPLLSPVVTKRVGLTGDYRVSFTATIAGGFQVGKAYNVIVTVTVAGITEKAPINSFILVTPVAVGASFTV